MNQPSSEEHRKGDAAEVQPNLVFKAGGRRLRLGRKETSQTDRLEEENGQPIV